ncbi:palmitoyltransferase ZDHHC21 isoform X3 [Rhinoraja longicauda]
MGLRFHFVYDPQGWSCVGIITFIWLYNTYCIPKLILYPHYEEEHVSAAVIVAYYLVSFFCVASLMRASIADPGRLQQDPEIPYSERENWETCDKCNKMRPKRSHHCSRCGHCVRKMDHHCPWINNCVGEDNQWLFLLLCFYTQFLSLFTLILNFCQYYYLQPLTKVKEVQTNKDQNITNSDNFFTFIQTQKFSTLWELFMFRHELALLRISTLMALVMIGGMSGIFFSQLTNVLTDVTTIERMSSCPDEIFKPRKPWQQTFSEVFGTHWKIVWFIPFRQRQPLRATYHHANHV